MSFGNVPADMLVGAVEKLLAKMDETDLAAFYERELSTMPAEVFDAFVEAIFAAFRERGESSEDAAEGAGTTLDGIERRESGARLARFLEYARDNPGPAQRSDRRSSSSSGPISSRRCRRRCATRCARLADSDRVREPPRRRRRTKIRAAAACRSSRSSSS